MNRHRTVQVVIIAAIAFGLLVWAIRTRPNVPRVKSHIGGLAAAMPLPDPLTAALLGEMRHEHHLDVGLPPGHALSIARKDGRVEVTLSEELLQDLGPGTLDTLGLPDRTVTFTWSKYLEFLERLHVLVATRHPGADDGGAASPTVQQ